jgi:hypothetical protein
MFFHSLSNEEKFALADFAACEVEKRTGVKMTKEEYEEFVWNYVSNLGKHLIDKDRYQ